MHQRRVVSVSVLALALLALSLSATSSASAAQYKVETVPAFVQGVGEGSQTFTAGAKIECAAKKNAAVIKAIAGVVIALVALYEACKLAGQSSKVETNECVFEAGEPTGSASPFTVKTVKIACPTGKEIVVTATTAGCTIKIGSQTTTGTTTAANAGSGTTRALTFGWNISGIKYTSSGGICGTSGTTGTYSGKEVIKAYSDEAHTKQEGIFVG